jgi:hypothetical protein
VPWRWAEADLEQIVGCSSGTDWGERAVNRGKRFPFGRATPIRCCQGALIGSKLPMEATMLAHPNTHLQRPCFRGETDRASSSPDASDSSAAKHCCFPCAHCALRTWLEVFGILIVVRLLGFQPQRRHSVRPCSDAILLNSHGRTWLCGTSEFDPKQCRAQNNDAQNKAEEADHQQDHPHRCTRLGSLRLARSLSEGRRPSF